MRTLLWTIAALLVFGASECLAKPEPSFDCNKASTQVERLVCSDTKLSELNSELDKAYRNFMKSLTQEDKNGLLISHEKWNDNLQNQSFILLNAYTRRVFHLGELYKERIKLYNDSINNFDVWKKYKDKIEEDTRQKYRQLYVADSEYKRVCEDVNYFLTDKRDLNFIKLDFEDKNVKSVSPFESTTGISTSLIDIDNNGHKEIVFRYESSLPSITSTKKKYSINYYIPLPQEEKEYDIFVDNIYLFINDIFSSFNNNPENCNNINIYIEAIEKREQDLNELNLSNITKEKIKNVLISTKSNLESLLKEETSICSPQLLYKILKRIPLGETIKPSKDLVDTGAVEFFKHDNELYIFIIPYTIDNNEEILTYYNHDQLTSNDMTYLKMAEVHIVNQETIAKQPSDIKIVKYKNNELKSICDFRSK